MPRMGFKPTIPMFERPKTVRDLDRAAIGTGISRDLALYFRNLVWLKTELVAMYTFYPNVRK
jgi:hypothetical protein